MIGGSGGVGDEEGLDVDVDVDVGEHIPNILRKKRKRARGGGGGGWDQIKMKEGVQRWRGAIDEEQRTRGEIGEREDEDVVR